MAVTHPGDTVGIESPTYFNLMPLFGRLGLKALEIPTHPETGLSLDALEFLLNERRLQAVIAMPNVQNPLGSVMPLAAKRRLAALVNEHQVPLIEDGVFAELQFTEPVEPAVKAFDQSGWILACSSFTKTLAPGFRVGWLDGGRFHREVAELKFTFSFSQPALLSEAVAVFLESGGYDAHLRRLRRTYAAQMGRRLLARTSRRTSAGRSPIRRWRPSSKGRLPGRSCSARGGHRGRFGRRERLRLQPIVGEPAE